MRALKKAFWFFIAILFLIETWLWDHMVSLIRRIVAAIPLEKTKAWIIAKIEPLSPWPTLLIFAIPAIILEPFKIIGLWLLAQGHVIAGIFVFLAAKIIGLGVIAFLFEACKPKLMQFKIIAWTYNQCILAKEWAKLEIEPMLMRIRVIKSNLRVLLAKLLPNRTGLFEKIMRRVRAIRRKLG